MATEDLVTEQFQFLGIDVQKEVLTKCVSLCEEYTVDAETLVEQWMAFSLTHLNGAPPSLEHLEALERKEFSKRGNAPGNEAALALRSTGGTGLVVYGAPAHTSTQPETEILSNYITTSPKRVKVEKDGAIQQNELCPATYSPSQVHSAKYASRSNAGTVVHFYGDEKLSEKLAKPESNDILNLNITQVPNDDGEIYTKSSFGFELLHEKASIFDNHTRYISQCICKKANITEVTSVRHKTHSEVYVAGRIECDADARLNPKSVMLQGTWEGSLSLSVSVDLDNLKQYSLFPGQVVVMRGVNPRGDKFIAHEVYTDASLPIPDIKADVMNILKGTMSMVVAAGPYTISDNMFYEPLKDLITYIDAYRPHVVIMTGPFLDSEHSKVKDYSMAENYKAFFDKLLDNIGELSNTSPHTKIYIVSSTKDAFHVNIYPTPPYGSRRKLPNVHFIPDPCTLNISGLIVGVTSTDVLMHLSQEEIALNMSNDKLSRLCSHVAQQQCYYPVQSGALCVDAALWAAHAQLSVTPHIFILPSNFRYFVKEVNASVVVNPEHLTKGTGGGTFARIIVSSEDDFPKNVAAQIIRI